MHSPHRSLQEQYRLVMECRQSGQTDYQWCIENNIRLNTFYSWIHRLRQQAGHEIPEPTKRRTSDNRAKQEVVRVDFSSTPVSPQSEPLQAVPASVPVTATMELLIHGHHLRITNEVNPALLTQMIRLLQECPC